MSKLDSIPGIDHMAVHSTPRFLSLQRLAEAREVAPAKFLDGLGLREMALACPQEDVVTLAAGAGAKVLAQAGVLPEQVGCLVVGTESQVDRSKPVATLVHELLGVSTRCRVFDVVHACIGGTYGLLAALDWLAAGRGEYALVIASDVALYERLSPGEPTQGAGAVAMLLSRQPRLMTIEETGRYSTSVYDFWKPLESRYPVVNGHFSNQCYISALRACLAQAAPSPRAACCYHTPYPKLVRHAHNALLQTAFPDLDQEAHFKDYVAPGLDYAARIGNIYTGSLWLALASLLSAPETGPSLRDRYDGLQLFSYGSGLGSCMLRGRFTDLPPELLRHLDIRAELDARIEVDMDQYERLRACEPVDELPPGGPFVLSSTADQQRQYARISNPIAE